MIVYWSMIGWVILINLIYSMSHNNTIDLKNASDEQIIDTRVPWVYAIITFGYIMFWVCIRRSVGDTITYIPIFESMPDDYLAATKDIDWSWSGSKGPLFTTFNAFFKSYISEDYTLWLTTIAIITALPIIKQFHKYSVDFFLTCYLFVTLGTFFWMMNGMRQFICVGILFGLCEWIKDGKFIRFLFVTLILSFVHLTCIIMIPAYFIARAKPWKFRTFLFIIGIILISIFAEPFFNGVDSLLGGTAYSYSTQHFSEDDGVNPLRFLFYSTIPIITFIKSKDLEIYFDRIPLLPICINMSLLTAGMYFVGIFTSGILVGRTPIYCELYNLLLVPYVINFAFNDNSKKFVKNLVVLITLVYFYFNLPSNYDSELTGWIN